MADRAEVLEDLFSFLGITSLLLLSAHLVSSFSVKYIKNRYRLYGCSHYLFLATPIYMTLEYLGTAIDVE